MNLQSQIELINNPQDFTRLYNAILIAEYGDNYLPIDDDRSDRGNDGYLKSGNMLFAGHCFKRLQNQSIDKEIRDKVMGDLKKAIKLKNEGLWVIKSWTFLSNYPLPEAIANDAITLGKENGINVGWRGPEYFATVLQKYKHVREQFPNLQGNEIMDQLESILKKLEPVIEEEDTGPLNVPQNSRQLSRLLTEKPPGWEYLLFAGTLFLGKEALEPKWRDYEMGYARRTGRYLEDREAIDYLSKSLGDLSAIVHGVTLAFTPELQERAFGPSGVAGDEDRIKHLAQHVINSYEDILDWSANIRGAGISDNLRKAYDLSSAIVANPINEIRSFIDDVVAQVSKVPDHLSAPKPNKLIIELTLSLTVDNKVISASTKEIKRARKLIGK